MNKRLRKLRKEILKLTLKEFGKSIALSPGALGDIENERRNLQERHIKLISQTFNVNEEWLRNGTEPIFNEEKEVNEKASILISLEEQGIKPNVLTLIETYLDMTEDGKKIFDEYLEDFIKKKNQNSENKQTSKESYR